MASGWDLKAGNISKYYVSESDFWSSFNYIFSDACRKRSTYKFGLIKSILDNLLNARESARGMELSYSNIFGKFAENYWNLIAKHNLNQMRKTSRSDLSGIEMIIQEIISHANVIGTLEFSSLSPADRKAVTSKVTTECKKYVVGALYNDFEGKLYGFDLRDNGIWINPVAYEFMLKYKPEIEQLNYCAWAKFLEAINADEALVRVFSKLELSTPRRTDLSPFRKILQDEFETDNCFYCGRKLHTVPHVDHVIPWSFVKEDHLWNFVLACPTCNTKKNNKVPTRAGLSTVIARNEKLLTSSNNSVIDALSGYNSELMWRIWDYAKFSGICEFTPSWLPMGI